VRAQDIHVTIISESLDQVSAQRLRHQLRDQLLEGRMAHAIDLRELACLDSPTLAALIQSLRAVREAGGTISLLVRQPHIIKILSITGLDRIFAIYADVEAAAAALNARRPIPA